MRSRYEEYVICTERHHEASGFHPAWPKEDIVGEWDQCSYCGTLYAVSRGAKVIEEQVPRPGGPSDAASDVLSS